MNATSREIMRVLAPLEKHRSQLCGTGNKRIGGYRSGDPNCPTISHRDFVIEVVLPTLSGTCKRFGKVSVAKSIANLANSLYKRNKYDDVACFLCSTLISESEIGNISRNVTNPLLAEKYGIDYVFVPIVKLGIVHQRKNVFCASKFFHHHACRMGELIDNFSKEDYHSYIELCVTLLEHGIYDWSLEQNPEKWGMLRPSIKLYGLRAVFTPVVQAMIDIGHLIGTKDPKLNSS
jgi:hypothetical protein